MKKKDMATLVEGIRRLTDDLKFISDVLEGKEPTVTQADLSVEEQPAESEVPEETPKAAEPVSEEKEPEPAEEVPSYTFEQVRGILAEKSRSGHREEVKALITKYGGIQLSDYKEQPDVLAAIVKEAEGL